jgi:hypothetical protein
MHDTERYNLLLSNLPGTTAKFDKTGGISKASYLLLIPTPYSSG